RGNGLTGVTLLSSDNVVGGADPASRNIISGNDFSGVVVGGPKSTGYVIQGNFIGTDDTGAAPLGNHGAGVRVFDPAEVSVTDNVIAFNAGAGVLLGASVGTCTILGNAIFANGGLGIDLGNNGPTANDPLDADAGPNGLQNFPLVTSGVVTPSN